MEQTKQEEQDQVLGFWTKDEELITIPFYQLKPIFQLLKGFELPIAAMHHINDQLINNKQSHPFTKNDLTPEGGLTKDFIDKIYPKEEQKPTIIVDTQGNTNKN